MSSAVVPSSAGVATSTYRGSDVPKPADGRVPANLWVVGGGPPSSSQPVEVVVESLTFTP